MSAHHIEDDTFDRDSNDASFIQSKSSSFLAHSPYFCSVMAHTPERPQRGNFESLNRGSSAKKQQPRAQKKTDWKSMTVSKSRYNGNAQTIVSATRLISKPNSVV